MGRVFRHVSLVILSFIAVITSYHVGAVTVNVSSADASSWVRSIGDTWDLRPLGT